MRRSPNQVRKYVILPSEEIIKYNRYGKVFNLFRSKARPKHLRNTNNSITLVEA